MFWKGYLKLFFAELTSGQPPRVTAVAVSATTSPIPVKEIRVGKKQHKTITEMIVNVLEGLLQIIFCENYLQQSGDQDELGMHQSLQGLQDELVQGTRP